MKFKLNIDKNADEYVEATLKTHSDFTDRLEELVSEYNGSDKITAYSDGGIISLTFANIEYITVIDSKTYAFDVKGRQYLIKSRLYEVENILPASFFRPRRRRSRSSAKSWPSARARRTSRCPSRQETRSSSRSTRARKSSLRVKNTPSWHRRTFWPRWRNNQEA